MDFTNLRQNYNELLEYLKREEYTESYIRIVRQNIRWMLKNEKQRLWQSYVDVYNDRVYKSKSDLYKKNHRIAFGAIQRFDLCGEFPNRRVEGSCLIKRGAYHELVPEFREVIDFYKNYAKSSGLKEDTINGNASGTSVFLNAMQDRGKESLDAISEEDVLSFFVDNKGNVSKSSSYKKEIAAVFMAGIEWKEAFRVLLAYLPKIRPRRKNIQFLTTEETKAIRLTLDDCSTELSLRDRAIGNLLFFTGIRACDIANMKLDSIDWDIDEIRVCQQKTDQPLVLPLTAIIGNAILEYLENERPQSNDSHLFLGESYPHYPFKAGAVWDQAAKIYKAASIRQNEGDRRGTHLFRYNVATSFLGNSIPRAVVSQTLGHVDPTSLDTYLHTDLVHLKECALDISGFPVSEEVFFS